MRGILPGRNRGEGEVRDRSKHGPATRARPAPCTPRVLAHFTLRRHSMRDATAMSALVAATTAYHPSEPAMTPPRIPPTTMPTPTTALYAPRAAPWRFEGASFVTVVVPATPIIAYMAPAAPLRAATRTK